MHLAGLGKGKTFDIHILDINKLDVLSEEQFESIEEGTCYNVSNFNDNKLLTEAQLKRYNEQDLKELFEENELDFGEEGLFGLRLGITRFIKYKAIYHDDAKITTNLKNKGIDIVYTEREVETKQKVYSVKYQSILTPDNGWQAFNTLTEAKTFAQEILVDKGYWSVIYKTYIKDGQAVSNERLGSMKFEPVGEMKSRPSKKPKSYIVLPEYLYAYSFTYTELENEW